MRRAGSEAGRDHVSWSAWRSSSAITTASSSAIDASQRLRARCAAASSLIATSDAGGGAEQLLMQQARQLRQRGDDVRRLGEQPPLERAPADLVLHPALEKRLRGHPQVEVGIELAAEAFDVEQRLLQQHELRLDLDVEPARRAEQLHQHLAERDLLQRPVEDRLADDADLGLELVDARVRRHPARLDVRGRDAVVVAAEEREEVLREIALVASRTACP